MEYYLAIEELWTRNNLMDLKGIMLSEKVNSKTSHNCILPLYNILKWQNCRYDMVVATQIYMIKLQWPVFAYLHAHTHTRRSTCKSTETWKVCALYWCYSPGLDTVLQLGTMLLLGLSRMNGKQDHFILFFAMSYEFIIISK